MNPRDPLINFLKSVSTALKGYDFAHEEELDSLPRPSAARIEELEDLLSGLSLEADGLLCRMGIVRELYKRGGEDA